MDDWFSEPLSPTTQIAGWGGRRGIKEEKKTTGSAA